MLSQVERGSLIGLSCAAHKFLKADALDAMMDEFSVVQVKSGKTACGKKWESRIITGGAKLRGRRFFIQFR